MPTVTHLVVDSNAFLKNVRLEEVGENIYTVRSVIEEIKDRHTRQRLEVLPYTLHVLEPSEEGLAKVIQFSKVTGDYAVLSKADLHVLAVAHDLHVKYSDIPPKSDPPQPQKSTTFEKQRGVGNKDLPGFVHCEEDNEEDDDEGWIDVTNYRPKLEVQDKIPVGCYTTDFAMQNTLMSLGLDIVSPGGQRVKTLRTWTLRCYACFKLTNNMEKKFCPSCGYQTLKRVAVTIDENGEQKVHLNPKVKLSGKGKIYPLPKPQGGKHTVQPIYCEDQRITEDRATRQNRRVNDVFRDDLVNGTSPFLMKDVVSKSTFLHRGTKYWERRNPNASHK